MASLDNVLEWRGMDVIDPDGDKIGSIEEIYVDQETDRPEWALISSGVFGGSSTFLPLTGANEERGTVRVPFDEGHVKDAPSIDPSGDLTRDEEAQLYRHYGMDYGEAGSSSGLPQDPQESDRGVERPSSALPDESDRRAAPDRGHDDPDLRDRAQRRGTDRGEDASPSDRRPSDADAAGPDTRDREPGLAAAAAGPPPPTSDAPPAQTSDESRSAERLRVADERPSPTRPRLRRYVVTEVTTASGTQEVEREQVAETELGEEEPPRR